MDPKEFSSAARKRLFSAPGQDPDSETDASSWHASSELLSPGLLHFTTDVVEQRLRLDYWIGAISETIGSISASSHEKSDFRCALTVGVLDALYIVSATGSQQDSARTRSLLAGDVDHSYHLMVDYGLPWTLRWRGADVHLRPGDLVLTDSRYVHSGHYLSGCSVTNIKMPPTWLQAWLLHPDRMAGRRIAFNVGWGRALSRFVANLTPRLAVEHPLPPKVIADHLGSLLALVESEFTGRSGMRPENDTLQSAHDLVRQRAAEPGLSATDIANALGMTDSELHRGLAATGETFGALLQRIRLDHARDMLEARHLNRLTTAEIGRRAGFSDPSHFIRAATRYLGLTPARYRGAHQR